MDARQTIEAFLAEVRRRLVRRDGARVALLGAAVLAILALALPLIAADPARAHGARTAGITALALLAVAGLARGVLGPRRRWAADPDVARFVGAAQPTIASDLLSAVELTGLDTAPHRAAPVSAALIGALADATARRTEDLDAEALVDRAPLRRPGAAAGLALLVLGATVALAPTRMVRGVGNLLAPAPPARFADAEEADAPLVGDLSITLEPPAYTGRPATRLDGASGDFRAMPGTLVRISTTALAAADKAFLVLDGERTGDEADRMVPLEIDHGALAGQLVIASATRYRFLLVDASGHQRIERRARVIDLEADRAPTVELHAPADELDVSGLKRIELAYLADDDHGLAAINLVWQGPDGEKRMPLFRPDAAVPRSKQDKLYWDLAEVGLRPGATVAYWVEAADNDSVRGPNLGTSRRFSLRVLSPREKHERLLAAQREAFEELVRQLAGRLTLAPADGEAHGALGAKAAALVVELGTLVAALEKDPLADHKLIGFLGEVRGRLDKATDRERKLIARLPGKARGALPPHLAGQLGAGDKAQAAALEDDVLGLASWLDRQDLEGLLAIADEIATHRKRLDKLMEEYARTGSEEIKREIERELRALEQLVAEQANKHGGMAEDVLDQFVNREAIDRAASEDCLAEVRRRLAAGDAKGARQKMAECGQALDRSAAALEEALGELRGDRFSAEQKKLDELESDLRDLAQDQREIAGKLDDLNRRYTEKAAERMKEEAKRVTGKLSETVDKLQRRLARIPDDGLGAFEQEELGAVKTRVGDLERMLADGDLAEALAMARQAEAGLETIAGELEAAIEDAGDQRWRRESERALGEVEKARPVAGKLVDELARATPSPAEILGKGELAEMDRLRRAQQAAGQRAARLGDKAKQMAGDLPGQAGEAIGERLEQAGRAMGRAEERMKARDPSGARPEARAAAKALEAAGKEARGAARMRDARGDGGLRDEPVRIPGADEYKPPADLREQIMDAMKRQGEAPSAYGEMLKRYYEELAR